ncbi:FAD binding domain-containing protein [Xylariomycetidae sp. FL2044]|nr:FAD binding domain-containing protein [Xylariomycetidae sp. FL2044]
MSLEPQLRSPRIVSLFWFVYLIVVTECAAKSCKLIPADPDWPSSEVWSQLNETIQGGLLQPTPPGAVCHPSQASYNATKCVVAQYAWSSPYFHDSDPVSSDWNNWNNDSCLPLPDLPCSSQGYPLYVINATTPDHVAAGIDFAREHNIRLVVKNSGHDYLGRSTAANSLSIWVHHMKGIDLREEPFRPLNCNFTIDEPSITAAAGAQMLEAYQAAAAKGYTVIGGGGRTVALGGFITGGGHSILAPHHGLAVDHVLELEVVTPRGEILTVNECQHQDLFWALRGGGGSTFGVITSVTMKIIPSPELTEMNFYISSPSDHPHVFDMIAYMVSKFPSLADAGVSGYPSIFNRVPTESGQGTSLVSGINGKIIMLDTRNEDDIKNILEPIFDHINSTWPGFTFASETKSYKSHYEWYEVNYDPSPVGYSNIMSSRLLDEKALTSNLTASKVAFERFSAGGQATVYIVSGKGVHQATPRGGSTASSPAWRSAYVHATASFAFAAVNETAKAEAEAAVTSWAAALRELSPNTGAYLNEADRNEPDWQNSFWGSTEDGNYPRLAQIKRQYDPDDVFWCTPCVGNEGWMEDGNRLCRI